MRRAASAMILAALSCPPAAAQSQPSGLLLELDEIILEAQAGGEWWVRFRYVAEGLETRGYTAVEGDFAAICATEVLPWLAEQEREVRQAVISIASAPVEFGQAAPGVTQFFEAFRIEDGACIWEAF